MSVAMARRSPFAASARGRTGGAALSSLGASPPAAAPASPAVTQWTAPQASYRRLLVALREAYYHDRAKLFWARHRARVEYYKYAEVTSAQDAAAAVGIANEVAAFVAHHMRFSVQRVADHNEAIAKLPVEEAKRFRQKYLEREEQHDVWCRTRIREILRRRPAPAFPYC
jgi:hypothetical protein